MTDRQHPDNQSRGEQSSESQRDGSAQPGADTPKTETPGSSDGPSTPPQDVSAGYADAGSGQSTADDESSPMDVDGSVATPATTLDSEAAGAAAPDVVQDPAGFSTPPASIGQVDGLESAASSPPLGLDPTLEADFDSARLDATDDEAAAPGADRSGHRCCGNRCDAEFPC